MRFGALVLAAVVSTASPAPLAGQSNASGEYQIKAAFLFHFAQFVEWPRDAFPEPDSPLTYCTLGEDPFEGALEAALSGKSIEGRPFRVQHLMAGSEMANCQILFIATREKKLIPKALASVKEHPVLTVGESDHFVQDGGIIGFCNVENKIRFQINLDAAGRARLKISSKLLALATTVVGSTKGS